MPRIACIKGCIYFAGLDAHCKPICTRVPRPLGEIEAYRGCYWGERKKAEKETEHESKEQGRLF